MMAFLQGLGLGGSLIIAIGAQNTFVLSNAIRRQHALPIALGCVVIDVVLILLGVYGLGHIIEQQAWLPTFFRYAGAAFLFVYGALACYRVWRPQGLNADDSRRMSLLTALVTTAAISLLNPHVYLDTVILLGSIGSQLPATQTQAFTLGACVASALWFISLALLGRWLAPWFSRPSSWQILDGLVALTMWAIAIALVVTPIG